MDIIEKVKYWSNENQGFLAVILFLITTIIVKVTGLFKYLINLFTPGKPTSTVDNSHTFIQKSGKCSKNIQGKNITLNKYKNDK
ncbi:MAG: hypothetical protein US54_C0026G0008 [Candidatus Roizmanbacteria bacterium GW2011_GWA2_37_7]|uniref:Uncharacterized protein n=1 Tax=Candidatus Roizmanbacteria bacterium GW2011_GWA2_37_7 TaxID=1618481 RepID=A0A0G0JM03_9BACT|nr:MAG: hypothetical protein US54_C0026G0008 [Candidatus Roizmanbacteria bacterium GW2011_GWA2_37_7]